MYTHVIIRVKEKIKGAWLEGLNRIDAFNYFAKCLLFGPMVSVQMTLEKWMVLSHRYRLLAAWRRVQKRDVKQATAKT